MACLDLVADGVQEVRLAEADAAVEKERVVAVRGRLGDGARGGVRELIRRADDEVLEQVAGVERRRPVGERGPLLEREEDAELGAFEPRDGRAFRRPYSGRTTANWVDFLQAVDQWAGPEAEAVFAIVDNLSTHRAADVLLFSLAYPRWHFVFQPTYAAYLEPD